MPWVRKRVIDIFEGFTKTHDLENTLPGPLLDPGGTLHKQEPLVSEFGARQGDSRWRWSPRTWEGHLFTPQGGHSLWWDWGRRQAFDTFIFECVLCTRLSVMHSELKDSLFFPGPGVWARWYLEEDGDGFDCDMFLLWLDDLGQVCRFPSWGSHLACVTGRQKSDIQL